MDVEAKPAFASGNIEIEAAIAEMQVPRRIEGIIDRAEQLPIGMRAAAMAAEIAIGGQPEAIAEVAVIAPADQRIGPTSGGSHAYPWKQTRIEPQIGLKPPGAKPGADIGELHRVLESTPENDPRAHIHVQLGGATLEKDVMGVDGRADRQVDGVDEKPEIAVTNFERAHERRPVEMSEKMDEADIGIDFWLALQRRRRRRVDTRHPEIRRHEELESARYRRFLCGSGIGHRRNCSNARPERQN